MAAISSNGTTGNWTGANTAIWTGGVVPTAADDVTITTSSVLTIPASTTVVCRSLTINSGATLAFAATTSTLTIGDGTAGTGNVALSINSGSTITLTGIGTINFVSTSATQQTVTSGGKTLPNMTFNGAGGSWILSDALTSSTITVSAGTFDTGNQTITAVAFITQNNATRVINLGSSAITLTAASGTSNAWGLTNAATVTFGANTAVVTLTGSSAVFSTANYSGYNGLSLVINSSGSPNIGNGTLTLANLTRNGAANQTDSLVINSPSITITGTFTVTGNSAVNRVTVLSGTLGTARTITAAAVSLTNVDFMDITGAGAASPFTGTTLGDRQGNSGITFTTPATQTRDSTSGSAWSVAARWTSRVPLPQDDVVLNASSGSISSTDVLCLGKSIDMTNYAGTVTHTSNAGTYLIFGSLNLGGVTWGTAVSTFNLDFMGRSSYTITSNGKTLPPSSNNQSIRINAFGGTYTLADALTQYQPTASSVSFTLIAGSFNSGSYSMSIGRFITSGSITRSATFGSSIVSLTTPIATSLISTVTSGLTWSASSATFNITNSSNSTTNRSIDLQGLTIGTLNYTVANSNAGLTITSSGTITNFNIGTGRLLTITAGQTLTTSTATLTGTTNGYIYMPGDNYGASAPDSAALSITGDFDFRQRMSFDTLAPSGSMRIAGKYNSTGSQQTWRLYMTAASALVLDQSTTGSNSSLATSSATLSATGLSAGTTYWIRFTREQSTGNVKFYYAADNASMPSSWTQIGTTQTATTSALFDSTAALTIGGDSTTTNPMPGRYYWSQLRNNILDNGTGIQFDAVFSSKTVGADTFTESSSNAATVTMNGLSVYGDGRLQISSSSAGTAGTISSSGNVDGDYMVIKDSTAANNTPFYAGANSINVSGNTNWTFTARPGGGNYRMMMGMGA